MSRHACTQLPALADGTGYSQLSYNFVLFLYVISFPGIYSLVKRSVKSKVVRKTYEVPGPASDNGRPTKELAGDIVAFFQANNYKITDVRNPQRRHALSHSVSVVSRAPPLSNPLSLTTSFVAATHTHTHTRTQATDVIVFEGTQAPLIGRAAFLTFCVFICLGSLALVCTIIEQVRTRAAPLHAPCRSPARLAPLHASVAYTAWPPSRRAPIRRPMIVVSHARRWAFSC